VFVFWIGLAPAPFVNVLHVSVSHLLEQVQNANPDHAVAVAKMLIP